ncbi:phosphatidic acid phosphatase type 2/haloperoxidase [Lasiosphaeris hirsuta]|uniref:Phosphatidic acid phosphatase type 2/haloperoxidase n=1 Tax=Lasiosphaeris hirsuta TaxID=260670 RepID=A0AA39ZRF1_9PEZI|nr:phosphatidic acid phosphatase type 2/haloperoxidase [Lasiosphaeris hirsuta]
MTNEKWAATATPDLNGPQGKTRFLLQWAKVSWKDILAMAILGAASQAVYKAPLAAVRNFPITFSGSGDIVYPQFAYPERGWIISPMLSGILSALIPIAVILLAQTRIRSFWDANNAILGVLYALILGTLFQVIIKQLIGGFRPYFLDVCRPDTSRLTQSSNHTGLNGVGFHEIMYTVDVCTNPDKQALKNAMTSFPSGHSTAAFAGYVFLFLWMNAKLKVWSGHQTSFYWLALVMAPLLGATLMACALTIDQAHNWYDILAGSAIGTIMAFASYRICYAAVWDWRYNHIPLTRHQIFDYTVGPRLEYMERAVFIKKLGWGKKRAVRLGKRRGLDRIGDFDDPSLHTKNATTVSGTSNGESPRHPEIAIARGHALHTERGADDMV